MARLGRFLTAILTLGAGMAGAAAIEARPEAALSGSYGLELRLADPAFEPPSDAYVAVGADKGLTEERRLEVAVSLDPTGLEVMGRSGRLPFLRLSQTLEPGTARVVLFLWRANGAAWGLGAWSWDDASSSYVLAGQAPLQRESVGAVRLRVVWTAAPGQPGSLRIVRIDGLDQQTPLVDSHTLDNGSQSVGAVQVGVVAADPRGLVGRLLLDDIQVSRLTDTSPRRRP